MLYTTHYSSSIMENTAQYVHLNIIFFVVCLLQVIAFNGVSCMRFYTD